MRNAVGELMKKNKGLIILISVLGVIVLVVGSFAAAFALSKVEGTPSTEVWEADMKYDIGNTFQLQKDPGKDFVILNLTDIQYNDFLDVFQRDYTEKTIKELIERIKPDLITMTGDQIWAPFVKYSIEDLIEFMDSFKIPWAPVNGNHDGEGNVDLNALAELYEKSEYCLFRKGPSNIGGVGNFVINIMEGDVIVESLIMMDSGSGAKFDDMAEEDKMYGYELDDDFNLKRDENGELITRQIGHDYDYIKPEQVEWYRWCVRGAAEYNASKGAEAPESALFIHIALPEYYYAYCDYLLDGKSEEYGFFGAMREDVCCSKKNSGMFDAILEEGSTKFVFAGHDHVNDYSLIYKGVRLTYALKTGDRCYAEDDVNGGTVFTVGDSRNVRHEYVKID